MPPEGQKHDGNFQVMGMQPSCKTRTWKALSGQPANHFCSPLCGLAAAAAALLCPKA